MHIHAEMDEEKVKIKIDIAGESFLLSVAQNHYEEARQTEGEVNMLFDTWRERFPEKSDRELLAMIAFRYADHYSALMRERAETRRQIDSLNSRLENLLGAPEANLES